jgi:hypothetical protein
MIRAKEDTMPQRRPSLLLYSPIPGANIPPVAAEPDPSKLPRYVDNAKAIAIVAQHFTPATTLDSWTELVWWQFGRKKFCSTARLLEVAKAKLEAAHVVPPLPTGPSRYPHGTPSRQPLKRRASELTPAA